MLPPSAALLQLDFCDAALQGNLLHLQTALDRGADPLATTPSQMTALHWAAYKGHADCVALLLPLSNPNLPDCYGQTPLILAARVGHANCVRLLLPVSSTRHQDAYGLTALQYAVRLSARTGHSDCAQLIAPYLRTQTEQDDLEHHTPQALAPAPSPSQTPHL